MFEPLAPVFVEDPHAHYDVLRGEHEVLFEPTLNSWLVTGYHAAERVLRESRTFASDFRRAGEDIPDRLVSLQVLDPPDHGPVARRLVDAYRSADWAALEVSVRQATESALSNLADKADFVTDIAEPVAYRAITDLLGMPGLSRDRLQELSKRIVDAMDSGLRPAAAAAGAAARDELTALVREALPQAPPGSMLAHLAASADDIAAVNSARAYLHAGYAPVVRLLGNVASLLVQQADLLQQSAGDASQAWQDELLRCGTPVHAVSRVTVRETELAGVPLPQGAEVVVLVAAANRDPSVFPQPHTARPDRAGPKALTFGLGPHLCPGSSLARLLTRTVVQAFAARFPDARPNGRIAQQSNAVLRGPAHLPLQLRALQGASDHA